MANQVTDFFPDIWSRYLQENKKANSVAYSVSNLTEASGLNFGDRIHRPTSPDFVVNDYTRTGDNAAQDIVVADQYIDINKQKVVSFYVDKLDEAQSKYSIAGTSADRAVYLLANEIDQTRFAETTNAIYSADGATIGDSAGPISVVSQNFLKLFPSVKAIMSNAKVETDKKWYAVVAPEVVAGMEITALQYGFQKADNTMGAGYRGDFGGFSIFESTNLKHTYKLLAANLGSGKNVVIEGKTITYDAAASAASQYKNAADLVALINTGIGTQSQTLDDALFKKLQGAKATAVVSGSDVIITTAGALAVASNSVNATGVCYNEFGRMGAVDLVTQVNPEVQRNKEPKRSGYTYLIFDLYGVKTFDEGKERMVQVTTVPVLS